MTHCPKPWAGDNCDQLLADYYGRSFDIFQTCVLTGSAILMIFSTIQMYRYYIWRGTWRPMLHEFRGKLQLCLLVFSIMYTFQSIDPEGYRGLIDWHLVTYTIEFTSAILFTAAALVTYSLITAIRHISEDTDVSSECCPLKRVYRSAVIIFWVQEMGLSFIGLWVGYYWLTRVLRLLVVAIISIIMPVAFVMYGYRIAKLLNEKTSENELDITRRNRALAHRLLRICFFSALLGILLLVVTISALVLQLNNRFDNASYIPPQDSVVTEFRFTIFQWFLAMFLLIAYRKFRGHHPHNRRAQLEGQNLQPCATLSNGDQNQFDRNSDNVMMDENRTSYSTVPVISVAPRSPSIHVSSPSSSSSSSPSSPLGNNSRGGTSAALQRPLLFD